MIRFATNVPRQDHFNFMLGLPALHPGELWVQAVRLEAPLLLSANSLPHWHVNGLGLRFWEAFDGRHVSLVSQHPIALDSAGFVAARRYRGFPWPLDAGSRKNAAGYG